MVSSNEDVVTVSSEMTVDETGGSSYITLNAKSRGTATITGTLSTGETTSFEVNVSEIKSTDVVNSKEGTYKIGDTVSNDDFAVSLVLVDGVGKEKSVVGTITLGTNLEPLTSGDNSIDYTVKYGDYTSSGTYVVSLDKEISKPTSIQMTPQESLPYLLPDEQMFYTVSWVGDDGDKVVSVQSSDPRIATVTKESNNTLNVTALEAGYTVITATMLSGATVSSEVCVCRVTIDGQTKVRFDGTEWAKEIVVGQTIDTDTLYNAMNSGMTRETITGSLNMGSSGVINTFEVDKFTVPSPVQATSGSVEVPVTFEVEGRDVPFKVTVYPANSRISATTDDIGTPSPATLVKDETRRVTISWDSSYDSEKVKSVSIGNYGTAIISSNKAGKSGSATIAVTPTSSQANTLTIEMESGDVKLIRFQTITIVSTNVINGHSEIYGESETISPDTFSVELLLQGPLGGVVLNEVVPVSRVSTSQVKPGTHDIYLYYDFCNISMSAKYEYKSVMYRDSEDTSFSYASAIGSALGIDLVSNVENIIDTFDTTSSEYTPNTTSYRNLIPSGGFVVGGSEYSVQCGSKSYRVATPGSTIYSSDGIDMTTVDGVPDSGEEAILEAISALNTLNGGPAIPVYNDPILQLNAEYLGQIIGNNISVLSESNLLSDPTYNYDYNISILENYNNLVSFEIRENSKSTYSISELRDSVASSLSDRNRLGLNMYFEDFDNVFSDKNYLVFYCPELSSIKETVLGAYYFQTEGFFNGYLPDRYSSFTLYDLFEFMKTASDNVKCNVGVSYDNDVLVITYAYGNGSNNGYDDYDAFINSIPNFN